MKRRLLVMLVLIAAAGALAVWIANRTYWDTVTLPTPLRGEAATYPLYSAEGFSRRLGAIVVRESIFSPPPAGTVVYLNDWSWDLGGSRRSDIERWVEGGGRLVIDSSVFFQNDTFTDWSGIRFEQPRIEAEELRRRQAEPADECLELVQTSGESGIAGDPAGRHFALCAVQPAGVLVSTRAAEWTLSDRDGIRALRVAVGQGSVTVLRAQPFAWRGFFAGDHTDLFVAFTQLRGGDRIVFLSEARHPSLPALLWKFGAPAVVLAGLALALALWRNGMRFGPMAAPSTASRRSLAEQIRGTGYFTLRHGREALHRAMCRALDRAARAHVPGFAAMTPAERTAAIATASDIDAATLDELLQPAIASRARSLLSAVAQLELVRRKLLSQTTGRQHAARY